MKEEEVPRVTRKIGDHIVLPNGDIGIISQTFLHDGHSIEYTIYPFVNWAKRIVGYFLGWYRFHDGQIDKLQKIPEP